MPPAEGSDSWAFGGWSASTLWDTAQLDAGIGVDQDLPDEVRFIAGVAKLLRKRHASRGTDDDPFLPAIFLLCSVPEQTPLKDPPRRVPMLDNGREVVNGRIWFVGAPAVSGHYIAYPPPADDDELFVLITDTLGAGSAATVLFDPRPSPHETRFYPDGLSNPSACVPLSLADDDVSLDDVYSVIDRVYKACLVTPDAHPKAGKLWQDADRWWPSSNAEALVQMELQVALVVRFPTCVIRAEQSMPEGRDDLEIERSNPYDPPHITRLVLIELKVLRSFSMNGTSISSASEYQRIAEGVNQAYAYGDSKHFIRSTLCCFDMRRTDDGGACFNDIRERAAELSVDLRRWFVYSSSSRYRGAITAGRSSAKSATE